MISIRRSFSKKLSLGLMLLAVPIFLVSIVVLYTQSRHIIRNEAVGRANSLLTAAMQRLSQKLSAIETATDACCWLVPQYLNPDSLLALSLRIVQLNPHVDGCSISAEPDLFPEHGRYYSVYTIREGDSIVSAVEQQYEYFEKIWYKMPRNLNAPCWAAYFDDVDSLDVVLEGMIASYGKPLYDASRRFLGIISTDISLLRLSKVISEEERPYPNAYFMMIDDEGHYFIHPDPGCLFTHTIFDGVDPQSQADLITLGHEMTSGNQGNMAVNIDGESCIVCYQPVPGTNWSLALVCPDSDILGGYHQLTYILIPLIVIGLIIILLLCLRAVKHAISPLYMLLGKTQSIAEGNMEVHIPNSQRPDVVGRLQNSFASMLQSLNFHMGIVRHSARQTEKRNEELAKATRVAEEADKQKLAFIQNVSHQIRTPLNIIMGFAQVLRETDGQLPEEERKSITGMMNHNSMQLNRMVLMLFDSSDTGLAEELHSHKHDTVPCNKLVRDAIDSLKTFFPDANIKMQTEVDDRFSVHTNHSYLMRSLREIIYNAATYSDGQHIVVRVTFDKKAAAPIVRFIVEDKGRGIAEADRDMVFQFFTKIDDLSEGLGLGLPLTKRHITNLGGNLILDTDYHEGCRFIIELPLTL